MSNEQRSELDSERLFGLLASMTTLQEFSFSAIQLRFTERSAVSLTKALQNQRLRVLELEYTNLSAPPQAGQSEREDLRFLEHLEVLKLGLRQANCLWYYYTQGLLSELDRFNRLEALDLRVDVSNPELEGFLALLTHHVLRLTRLRKLSLYFLRENGHVSDALRDRFDYFECIANMPDLVELSLEYSMSRSDESLAKLCKLARLQRLVSLSLHSYELFGQQENNRPALDTLYSALAACSSLVTLKTSPVYARDPFKDVQMNMNSQRVLIRKVRGTKSLIVLVLKLRQTRIATLWRQGILSEFLTFFA